ncbi:MAG: cation transporter, partial [Nitrospirae bacterium]|nr:cation transporter [Nitrospirota bacterium]
IVAITGFKILDSVTAIFIACFILYEGIVLTKNSIANLLDSALPEAEVDLIRNVLQSHKKEVKSYDQLRTRKSGSQRHIDVHLAVCRNETIDKVHGTMDSIEDDLSAALPNSSIMIHPEPCIHQSENCQKECHWDNTDAMDNILKDN